MPLELHVPTLYALVAFVCLLLALAGEFIRRTGGDVDGMGWIVSGVGVTMLGVFLVALYAVVGRGIDLVGDPLIALGVGLILQGMRAFYGAPRHDPTCWPVFAAVAVASALSGLGHLEVRGHEIVVNGALALLVLRAAAVALGRGRRVDGAPGVLVGVSMGALGVGLASRAVHAVLSPPTASLLGDTATRAMLVAGVTAGIGSIVGVTAGVNLRLAREARRARTAMELLVGVTAHELRAPITSLLGALDIMKATAVEGSDPKGFLDMALRNAERLRYLVDDLLELERLEAGKAPLVLEAVEARRLVDDAVQVNETYASRFGVMLSGETGAGLPRLRADASRMTQVLTNLITNAVKHSPRGGTVRVTCSAGPLGARFEVSDTGDGIPADLRDRVFQRFVSRTSPSEDVRSTGLGLAITRSIVEAHGGVIGFETAEGKGTTFYVEVPAAP